MMERQNREQEYDLETLLYSSSYWAEHITYSPTILIKEESL
ncbi:MAG TPA: hypothetical protein VJK03_00720 [Candidatus Nanoarchaeia archaeon]|nr:hypothetical protein [Candidatus Nanoarchaeia archaeon]